VRTVRRGFTLFELVLVSAVLLIAMAAAIPSISSLWGSTPINAAADTVKARMAEARARAMADGRPYRFDCMANTGTLRIAPDSPDFWDDGSGDNSTNQAGASSAPPLVVEDNLPKDIRFCSPGAAGSGGEAQNGGSGGWICPIVFLPNGTTRQDAEIAFSDGHSRPLVVKVRSATGSVTSSY
jgi:prepilin-type N-terminal cleavage/methylation domain-containing protein